FCAAGTLAADESEKQFANPPDESKPWCYWWWLNGYVTRDAITRDLDQMRKQGISGALVFHAGQGPTPKSIEFMSREWRDLFRFAVEQAAKRNITIGLNLCGGWNAGGPWVTPEEAAKQMIYGVTRVSGPMLFDEALPRPTEADETYHDIAVLAWPIAAPLAAQPLIEAKLTASSSLRGYGPELAMDGEPETRWVSNGSRPGAGPRPDRPEYLEWTFAETFPAAAVHIVPHRACAPRDCQFQVSEDGKTYRTLCRFEAKPLEPQTFTFDETLARRFRLLISSSYPHRGPESWNVQVSEVMLLRKGQQPVRAAAECRISGMSDLTAKMDSAGRLTWEAPDGQWLVIRFGWRVNPRAHTKCTGDSSYLEIDPLSAEAMDKHFAATAGVVMEDVASHVGRTFQYVHIDSGEIGNPDWTPTFREQFKRLRGYDPLPLLAAKAGQIADDPATTERFLEDYDQTIGDLMIERYYGRLGELARKYGLRTHSEAAGYQKPAVDALRSMGCNDIAMSEFWSRRSQADPYIHQLAAAQLRYHDGIKNASAAAHVYGRRIVQAEAFTVTGRLNYDRDPFELKDIGDRAFCAGLNRNMLCFYVCQPEQDTKPGYEWPGVGMEFDRHVTWWPMSSAWLTYLARCQRLLQQGRFVADVCYFQGEWAPAYVPARWAMDPPLPPGCDCDTINVEALMARAQAGKDGRLVLPDGLTYRYLALWQGGRWQQPPRQIFGKPSDEAVPPPIPPAGSANPLALSPATLLRLKSLVEGGITLIGPRPVRAIGLTGYPDSDAEVKKLADELWGANSAATGERKVGKGRVIWGRSLAEVMQADGVRPDVEIREDPATAALPRETLSGIPHPGTFDWIHRAIGGADVYFVANLRNAAASGEFTFRVAGRQPELWDPTTGEIRDLPQFEQRDGRTVVPLRFEPRQSGFIVFRKKATQRREGRSIENFPRFETILEIAGPWEVRFDPKWGGPQKIVFENLTDWTQRPEEAIRYYSGAATYRQTFDLTEPPAGQRFYLDLGEVNNVARVWLNTKDLGVLWTAPRRVEITDAVKPRGNVLIVEVVNLWLNRLIGDASLPPEKRLTTSNAADRFKPDMPLSPSGLMGPVRLVALRSASAHDR
ncbi:discoidin domain-containing protein, partial [Candidatus Sumerlaeota bacterium]|nr:discoidin domain-containing protein [Candidatus Sumerlaeota bacterium]